MNYKPYMGAIPDDIEYEKMMKKYMEEVKSRSPNICKVKIGKLEIEIPPGCGISIPVALMREKI